MIAAPVYAEKSVGTCECGELLERNGDCETCVGAGTGCDDLLCAHDHCERCGCLLNTVNCDEDEEEHATEPHPTEPGYCIGCGGAPKSHRGPESPTAAGSDPK